MKYRLPVVSIAVALCALAPFVAAADEAPPIERARAAYEQRAEAGQAQAAWDLFKQAAAADTGSYAARWEAARACYYLGEYFKPGASDDEKMVLFQEGIDLAKQAIALEPKGVEGHFWLGVLYGVYGEAKGILKSLAMVPDIKAEMATCREIDPSVEGWGPDRVLGRMYYRLPFFKGGDNKKSLEHLEQSLKGAPTNALTRLYLAETCKSEGQKPRARQLLEEIASMTPDPRWAAEHPQIKAEAGKLLAKLK